MDFDVDALRVKFSQSSDGELRKVLGPERENFREEAIQLASEELTRRGLVVEEPIAEETPGLQRDLEPWKIKLTVWAVALPVGLIAGVIANAIAIPVFMFLSSPVLSKLDDKAAKVLVGCVVLFIHVEVFLGVFQVVNRGIRNYLR